MELTAGLVCDRGLNPKRLVNQDSYLLVPESGLFGVFDGVGGQRAGEVASQTAAETIQETVTHSTLASPVDLMRSAVQFANRDILEMADTEPSYRTMATTAALLFIKNGRAVVAHVGDSRVYSIQNGRAFRETIDHTDKGDLLRAGVITGAEAEALDESHTINRALGTAPDVEVEVKPVDLHDGDRLLLCTDGVYRHLQDDEIASIVSRSAHPQAAADEIKRIVCERGAQDNLTALVVQVGRDSKRSGSRRRADEVAAAGTNKRIRVELARREAGDDETGDRPKTARRPRRGVRTYVLAALVLIAGSFYAGLRASDFAARKRVQAEDAANPLRPARQLFDQGQIAAAESAFKRVIEADPKNGDAHYWLGRAQLQLGRFEAAWRSFEQAIGLKPELTDAYILAAAAYEADGKKDKAEAMLRRYAEEIRKR